ncbi:TPA: hypothetical protein ACJ2XA_001742, partial [Kluyvera georgiana]
MKVKGLIAKIRFSHIMCLSVGALIPIYSDVLFLHGFDSGTVSAIMDTIVAASVVYAGWSVRNWLKDKVKNKGFELAEKVISDIHLSYAMIFTLKSSCENFADIFLDGNELSKAKQDNLNTDLKIFEDECIVINKKYVEILTSIY